MNTVRFSEQKIIYSFASIYLEINYIPKRLTSLLQPADVCWMESLKRAYKDKWNNWFINELKTITSVGNIKPPGYAKVITWISEI